MGEVRLDGDFALEALGGGAGGQLGVNDLDGHVSVVLGFVGQVHHSHTPFADLALKNVPTAESTVESFHFVGHETLQAAPFFRARSATYVEVPPAFGELQGLVVDSAPWRRGGATRDRRLFPGIRVLRGIARVGLDSE